MSNYAHMNSMRNNNNITNLVYQENVERAQHANKPRTRQSELPLQLASSAETIRKLAAYQTLNKELSAALSVAQNNINTADKVLSTKICVFQEDVKQARCNQLLQNTQMSVIREQSCLSRTRNWASTINTAAKEMSAMEFINSARNYANLCKRAYRPQWARDNLLFLKIDQRKFIIHEEQEDRCKIIISAIISNERIKRQIVMKSYNEFYLECSMMQKSLASITEEPKMKTKLIPNSSEKSKANPPKAAWKCQMRFMLEDAWESKKKMMHEALDYLTALKLKEKDEFKRVKKMVKLKKEMVKHSNHLPAKNSERTTALSTTPPLPPPPARRPPSASPVANATPSANTIAMLTPPMQHTFQEHLSSSSSSPDNRQLRHVPQYIPHLVSSPHNVIEVADPNPQRTTSEKCKMKKRHSQLPILMSTEKFKRR